MFSYTSADLALLTEIHVEQTTLATSSTHLVVEIDTFEQHPQLPRLLSGRSGVFCPTYGIS